MNIQLYKSKHSEYHEYVITVYIDDDDDDDDNNIYSGTSNSAVAGLSGALTK